MFPPRSPSFLSRPQALPVQFRQPTRRLLESLPGRHPVTHGFGQVLRHVIAGGAVRSSETDVKVRTMLVSLVTAAARPATGAIGFREGAEEGATNQAGDPTKEGFSGFKGIRNRHNRL